MHRLLLKLFIVALSAASSAFAVGPLLQTEISWEPVAPDKALPQVPPNTQMRLSALVRNVGGAANAPGRIQLEFSLKDAAKVRGALKSIFQTEAQRLPSITPGQSERLTFARLHLWPSIEEFVEQEWGQRRYKAVVTIRGVQAVTGLAGIDYEARFIDGVREQQAQPFPEAPFTQEHPRESEFPRRKFPY